MVILQKVEECQNRNDYPYSIKRSRDDDATMVILHQIKGVRRSQSPPTNQKQHKITRLVQKKKRKKRAKKWQKKKDEKKYDKISMRKKMLKLPSKNKVV